MSSHYLAIRSNFSQVTSCLLLSARYPQIVKTELLYEIIPCISRLCIKLPTFSTSLDWITIIYVSFGVLNPPDNIILLLGILHQLECHIYLSFSIHKSFSKILDPFYKSHASTTFDRFLPYTRYCHGTKRFFHSEKDKFLFF